MFKKMGITGLKCKKYYDYIKTAREEERSVPIYSPEGEDFQDLNINEDYIASSLEELNNFSGNEYLVISLSSDKWFWPVFVFAKFRNAFCAIENKAENIAALIKKKQPLFVVVISHPENFSTPVIEEINKIQTENYLTEQRFYWGMIAHYNLPMLTEIIYKSLLFDPCKVRCLTINRLNYEKEIIRTEDSLTMSSLNSTPDQIGIHTGGSEYNVLNFISHGRPYLLWLKDGCIYGDFYDNDHSSSYWVPDSGEKVSASKISMPVMFINSCFSLLLNSELWGRERLLLYSSLKKNCIAYIGSPSLIEGKEYSNYLFLVLLNLGWPIGKITGFMNFEHKQSGLGTGFSYLLYGDPGIHYLKKANGKILKIKDVGKSIEFDVDENILLIEIEVPISFSFPDLYWGRLQLFLKTKQRCFITISYEQHTPCLIIFPELKFKAEKMKLFIKYGYNLDFLSLQKLSVFFLLVRKNIQSEKNYYENLKQLAQALPSHYKKSVGEINFLNKRYKKIEQYKKTLKELSLKMARYLKKAAEEEGFSFGAHAIDNEGLMFKSREVITGCPYCNGKVERLYFQHPLYDYIERIFLRCPNCGDIEDRDRDLNVCIKFEGRINFSTNEDIVQSVIIKNNAHEYIIGAGSMCLIRESLDWFMLNNCEISLELEPNKEISVPFIIKVKENIDIPVNSIFWLRGNFILNGRIFSIKKDIVLE